METALCVIKHRQGSVVTSGASAPSSASGSRLQTYAVNNGHSEEQEMEVWFWTIAAGGWLAISVDSARRQTPLLLLEQAHSR